MCFELVCGIVCEFGFVLGLLCLSCWVLVCELVVGDLDEFGVGIRRKRGVPILLAVLILVRFLFGIGVVIIWVLCSCA